MRESTPAAGRDGLRYEVITSNCLETELDPIAGADLRCCVNGELRRDGSTADMTYGILFLIECLSNFAMLNPGDPILTGSPCGTGALREPPSSIPRRS